MENAGNEAMDQAETSLKMLADPTDASVYASNDTSRLSPARLEVRMDSLLPFL